jgi:hypothetical protein
MSIFNAESEFELQEEYKVENKKGALGKLFRIKSTDAKQNFDLPLLDRVINLKSSQSRLLEKIYKDVSQL